MLMNWLIDDLLNRASIAADGYAAYAALILLLVSLIGSVPWKKRDGFRAASRTTGIVVASSGLLLLGAHLLTSASALLSGEPAAQFRFVNRALGPYAWVWWAEVFSKTLVPLLLWFGWLRRRTFAAILIAATALAGHVFAYVVYRIANAPRDQLPSSWEDLPSLLF
jgi:hypothetical protein